MASSPALEYEGRSEARDEVLHRTRAVLPCGRSVPVTLVNVSPHGLMARCDAALAAGDRLRLTLPAAAQVTATVRWALGGRAGCQLDAALPSAVYRAMLAAMA